MTQKCYICDCDTVDSKLKSIDSTSMDGKEDNILVCDVCLEDINQEYKTLEFRSI